MNDENLIPQAHRLTVDEQSRGGVRSGEVRRERRKLREHLEIGLDSDCDYEGERMSNAEAITCALIARARNGDVRAYQTIRDGLGERPADTVRVEERIPQSTYDEISRLLGLED